MRSVLFVCTGNLCRSPMAEYLLQERFKQLKQEDVVVESAGTIAGDTNRAAPEAIATMAALGIDMSAHRARRLTGGMIDSADLVIVMEKYHYNAVVHLRPEAAGKTVMMGKCLDGDEEMEIPDPYGGSREGFVKAVKMLKAASFKIADDLMGGKSGDTGDTVIS
ncbi:Low molecular weight protein tyrosine phosphatase [hydrothermal vent metagenome]|uniref:Low molecular weight protein tyrosine phosphatase n=1 Tax=hydrothermal vent metagenome TaxID=652676 RepID=A0A3B1BWP7_9ZZZZ